MEKNLKGYVFCYKDFYNRITRPCRRAFSCARFPLMKRNFLLLPGIAGLLALAIWLPPLGAQNESEPSAELLPIVQVLTQQQAAITENQMKIEASLARIQEDLRQSKIYASRSGKKAAK